MSFKVIGLTGYKQCGKSTLAKAILDEAAKIGRFGCIYSFAKPLKEICHILFGGNEDNWYGDLKTERFPEWELRLGDMYATPRRILQTMGTEIFRNKVADDFWLMVAERYITDIVKAQQCDFVVIDDVRFENEAQFIVANYMGTIARIQRAVPMNPDAHISERGLPSNLIDYSYTCPDIECVKASARDIVARNHV